MKVLGCLGFYNCYIKNLHVDSQPFYDLIKDSTPFQWTDQHKKLFNSIKEPIHKDTVQAVPSIDYLFHVGTGCILIQQFPEERELCRSTLVSLTKQNKKCPLFIENYAESYQPFRPLSTTSLDHHCPSIFIVIISQCFIYGDAKDNYRVAFFAIR